MARVPQVVFIGMPGSGKTRIGKEIATLMRAKFYDSDEIIEQHEKMSVSDIFSQRGESTFRRIEREIIAEFIVPTDSFNDRFTDKSYSSDNSHNFHSSHRTVSSDNTDSLNSSLRNANITFDGVLSLGGGAPMDAQTQENLRKYARLGGHVVYLNANADEAIEHATRSGSRPLLAHNPEKVWMDLYDKRHATYMDLATYIMQTHGKTPRQAANTVIDLLNEHVIHVSGATPEYDVRIGTSTMTHLPEIVGENTVRVALIHSTRVQRHSDKARAILRRAGYDVTEIVIPDAEQGKTMSVASRVWNQLGEIGFTRSDAIVGLGGGAATDLAGFVAATWLRGIPYINCPTSLLAMVDASTGGKTGINTDAGKNLVGSFYTPLAVLADIDTLRTLDQRIFIEGLGEVIKAGFISDPQILHIIDDNADMLRNIDPSQISDEEMTVITELISRSVRVKERHVSEDLREKGLREFLNYGHTLGHAIEKMEHFSWRHGEAVAVGMVFAAELAHIHNIVDSEFVEYTRDIISSVGLPTSWSAHDEQEVLRIMHRDKKARGNMLRFVVVDEIGHARRLEDPSEYSVLEALRRITR